LHHHRAYQVYVHVTWHTRYRRPCVRSRFVPEVQAAIADACERTGVRALRTAVLRDHVHLLLSLTPNTRLSDFLRLAKTISATRSNRVAPGAVRWARGYFVRSVGKRELPVVERYIDRQFERHPSLIP
jgi:putative transposase